MVPRRATHGPDGEPRCLQRHFVPTWRNLLFGYLQAVHTWTRIIIDAPHGRQDKEFVPVLLSGLSLCIGQYLARHPEVCRLKRVSMILFM